MGHYYVTENVDVDVKITDDSIISAIQEGKFSRIETASIVRVGNTFLSGAGIANAGPQTFWDVQWGQLANVIKQKFPNPDEFENLLRENNILID
jgi:hypothetical protein